MSDIGTGYTNLVFNVSQIKHQNDESEQRQQWEIAGSCEIKIKKIKKNPIYKLNKEKSRLSYFWKLFHQIYESEYFSKRQLYTWTITVSDTLI